MAIRILSAGPNSYGVSEIIIAGDGVGFALLSSGLHELSSERLPFIAVGSLQGARLVNGVDVTFKLAERSSGVLNGSLLQVSADKAHIAEYIKIIEGLIKVGNGHSYLDDDGDDLSFDLIVSIGEYPL